MATLKYLSQYFLTTLNVGGGIDASQTTGIILQSVAGVTDISKPGQICITYSDPIDTGVAEWIDYTSINGSNELVGVTRGREGFSAHTHLQGATVAFVFSASHQNDIVDLLNGTETGIKVKTALYDVNGNEVIKTPATTSAVNEITVTNAATGDAVQVSATGDDTNIDLKLVPKGTGAIGVPSGTYESNVTDDDDIPNKKYVDDKFATDGWISASEAWTYASASTITVPSGAASKYTKGDKIKITQTTVKYFYIIAVADTTLTVTGGADYTVANAAITNNYYSHQITPVGFPLSFSLGTPTFTSTGTAFTNQPQNNNWKFHISGSLCTISGFASTHATSGATGIFIATFGTGYLPTLAAYGFGSCINISNEAKSGWSRIETAPVVRFAKWDATQLAGNSEYFGFSVSYMF